MATFSQELGALHGARPPLTLGVQPFPQHLVVVPTAEAGNPVVVAAP